MSRQEPEVLRQFREAGVRQEGHFRLNDGRHSNVNLDMERLLLPKNAMRLRAVMYELTSTEVWQEAEAIVPVPNGALRLANEVDLPGKFPRIVACQKAPRHEFVFRHPAAGSLFRRLGRVAVFEDVVTTGWNALRVARAIQRHNPVIKLDLMALWRRGQPFDRINELFDRQVYAVEEEIPAWPEQRCNDCPLK